MFGEGTILSSKTPAPFARGVSETQLPFGTLWIGETSLPVHCSRSYPPEIESLCVSLVEAALEGERGNGSTIWESGGDDNMAWIIGALPLSGVVS